MKKKYAFLNCLAVLALAFANIGAETCCFIFFHQPKFPEKLRK